MKIGGAYLLKPEELDKVRGIILKDGRLNADIVGQPVTRLAELAGIEIPDWARVIIGEVDKIGGDEPFAFEKLSPILAMYRAGRLSGCPG